MALEYRQISAPLSMQVEITERCNNNCIHCYNHWRDNENQIPLKRLRASQLQHIVDSIIENKIFLVTLTGGEPLLAWKILPSAIQQLTAVRISVNLNSNLMPFTETCGIALKASGLKSILTSVLSYDEQIHDKIANKNGAFKKTIAGIKLAKELGFRVSANMVLLQDNFTHLYKTARFLHELGIDGFAATKASPAMNSKNFDSHLLTKEQLRESLSQLHAIAKDFKMLVDILECYPLCLIGNVEKFKHFARRSCSAGVTTCTVSSSGDVRPCSHADISYGNIFQTTLKKIWLKMDDWRSGKYIPSECISCDFLKQCSGGCRIEAKYHGSIMGKDPYMTSPMDVIKVHCSSIRNQNDDFVVTSQYRLSDCFEIRQETFGGVINNASFRPMLINQDALQVVRCMQNKKLFTINDIAYSLNVPVKSLISFFTLLEQKLFIVKCATQ